MTPRQFIGIEIRAYPVVIHHPFDNY
jgi:hypothetical protein